MVAIIVSIRALPIPLSLGPSIVIGYGLTYYNILVAINTDIKFRDRIKVGGGRASIADKKVMFGNTVRVTFSKSLIFPNLQHSITANSSK